MATKKEERAISARVDRAFGRACYGVQVPILKLTTIRNVGLAAVAAGADDTELERQLLESALAVGGIRS